MNCPDCKRIVFLGHRRCQCGAALPVPKAASHQAAESSPQIATSRALGAIQYEVDLFVARYRAKHPGATNREACIEYMRDKHLLGALPKSAANQAAREMAAERAAIQAEGT